MKMEQNGQAISEINVTNYQTDLKLTKERFSFDRNLYPNAEIYAWEGPAAESNLRNVNIINDELKLCDGVTLVHTPGHTMDSMSVFVEGEDRKYAVVGDAIPLEENYRKMVPPRLNVDSELAMKSINTIARFADVIVPGHGFPFMTR